MEEFFDSACVPGISKDYNKLTKLCGSHQEYVGEIGALKCLIDDVADVAFISMRTLKNHTGKNVFLSSIDIIFMMNLFQMLKELMCYLTISIRVITEKSAPWETKRVAIYPGRLLGNFILYLTPVT